MKCNFWGDIHGDFKVFVNILSVFIIPSKIDIIIRLAHEQVDPPVLTSEEFPCPNVSWIKKEQINHIQVFTGDYVDSKRYTTSKNYWYNLKYGEDFILYWLRALKRSMCDKFILIQGNHEMMVIKNWPLNDASSYRSPCKQKEQWRNTVKAFLQYCQPICILNITHNNKKKRIFVCHGSMHTEYLQLLQSHIQSKKPQFTLTNTDNCMRDLEEAAIKIYRNIIKGKNEDSSLYEKKSNIFPDWARLNFKPCQVNNYMPEFVFCQVVGHTIVSTERVEIRELVKNKRISYKCFIDTGMSAAFRGEQNCIDIKYLIYNDEVNNCLTAAKRRMVYQVGSLSNS